MVLQGFIINHYYKSRCKDCNDFYFCLIYRHLILKYGQFNPLIIVWGGGGGGRPAVSLGGIWNRGVARRRYRCR